MSGHEQQNRFDSLLDLAAIDDAKEPGQSEEIETIDNDSNATIPGHYPSVCRTSQIIVEDRQLEKKKTDGKGVPVEHMPVGQEETTQPFEPVDAAVLYALELPELFEDKIGDKITKLLG